MEGTNNIFQTTFCPQIPSDNNNADTNITATAAADQFIVEDLLNLSFDDADIISDASILDSATGNSSASSSTTAIVNSCNSSAFSGFDTNLIPDNGWHNNISDCHFSGDLCVPEDDLTDAGWLTNIVDDSFSGEELEKMQLISGMKVPNKDGEAREVSQLSRNSPIFDNEVSVPAKARSKRTHQPPCDWTSRLLFLSEAASSSYEPELLIPTPTLPSVTVPKKQAKTTPRRKDNCDGGSGGDGRRCLHCATDKTPQWRTGPKGPKTLCNACGVRYKSGRLVPEYRPAASPTFVMTKHSNSHRKVLELRRQKEMSQTHPHQHNQFLQHQNMMFDMTPNADDYLIHQHVGPDFRHLL
ncbi:GATA transcription factor 12-like [Vicia villosa]|uniref:GATA transcription factor 12-like n=1 Tax=Vicia villosa TaxID=3911 RepID=UPI00273C8AB8|nr:GATA transcription factor 12-like [Vicia villosa]